MVLLFPHHPLSFYPPFSSKISHPVKIVKDSIIFILGYLFKGLIIVVIKKSMLELGNCGLERRVDLLLFLTYP